MIPHSKPTINHDDISAVSEVVASGMIAQGGVVERFEKAVASYVGMKSGVAVSSGTSALHLALLALDIGAGDEVVLPSYVCTAPLNAINYTGATPVLADVDPETGNMTPQSVKEVISHNTKGIIVPHMMGRVADLPGINALGIPVIEDCAQAIGARYKGKPVGSFGDITICSFYATKVMATGEGGMVLSNDPEVISKVENVRDYDEKFPYQIRYNYKMTDIQAALGLSQLARLDDFVAARANIATYYDDRLSSLNVCSHKPLPESEPINFRYLLTLETKRDEFIEKMAEKGVSCRKPVFKPLHQLLGKNGFAQTDLFNDRAVSLPIYPGLTEVQMEKIVENVKVILGGRT